MTTRWTKKVLFVGALGSSLALVGACSHGNGEMRDNNGNSTNNGAGMTMDGGTGGAGSYDSTSSSTGTGTTSNAPGSFGDVSGQRDPNADPNAAYGSRGSKAGLSNTQNADTSAVANPGSPGNSSGASSSGGSSAAGGGGGGGGGR